MAAPKKKEKREELEETRVSAGAIKTNRKRGLRTVGLSCVQSGFVGACVCG